MTPKSVRKLRSLCARRESMARRRVSPMVTAALRTRASLLAESTLGGITRGTARNLSIGVTPTTVSVLSLYYAFPYPFVPRHVEVLLFRRLETPFDLPGTRGLKYPRGPTRVLGNTNSHLYCIVNGPWDGAW